MVPKLYDLEEPLRKKLGEWISEYVDIPYEEIGYDHLWIITKGVGLLLYEGVFDIESMRRDILKTVHVLLPYEFFETCLELKYEVENERKTD